MNTCSDRTRPAPRRLGLALGILVAACAPAFGGETTVKVEERPDEIAVDNGAVRFTVDRTTTGFLKELVVGRKTIVRAAGESGVFMEAVRLAAYDGRTIDPEGQKALKATPRLRQVRVERQGDAVSIVSSGELAIEGMDSVGWTLRLQTRPGEPLVQMALRLDAPGNPGTAAARTDRGRAWACRGLTAGRTPTCAPPGCGFPSRWGIASEWCRAATAVSGSIPATPTTSTCSRTTPMGPGSQSHDSGP